MTSVRGEELLAETFPRIWPRAMSCWSSPGRTGGLPTMIRPLPCGWPRPSLPRKARTSPVLSVLTHEKEIIGQKLISRKGPDGQAVLVVLQLSTELMAVDNMPFIKGVYDKVRDVQKEPDFPAGPGIARDRVGPHRHRHAEFAERKHREHRVHDDPAGDCHSADRLPRTGAGAGAAGVDRHILFHLDQRDCLVAQWAEAHEPLLGTIGRWIGRQRFDFQIFKTTQIFIIVVLFGAARLLPLPDRPLPREIETGLEPRLPWKRPWGRPGTP